MISPKVSIAAVMLALSLLLAPAAQGADADRIHLPRSAEIIGTSGTIVEFMAVYSCAPRLDPEPVYLTGIINQAGGGDTDYYEEVTCDGKTHTVTVSDGADLCDNPGEPCFVAGPATITATFYQTTTWIFGPRVSQSVMLRWPAPAAAV